MQDKPTYWLVRTRAGEILGPFTQSELSTELDRATFSPEDEIAPSNGQWKSAQNLVNRDDTEFTRTSTRNQTVTHTLSVTDTGNTAKNLQPHRESTPKIATPNPQAARTPQPATPVRFPSPSHPQTQRPPIVVFLVAIFAIAVTAYILRSRHNRATDQDSPRPTRYEVKETSPFLEEIQTLIRSGERNLALKKLREFHQKNPPLSEIAYLVPYAALLVTEGESISRARKLLQQVLASEASPMLKSRAQRWLGFTALSQEQDDLGTSHFLEALQLNPKDTAAKFNLGRAYLKQERPAEALEYFKLAELESPDMWLIHIYKGHAKVELSNFKEAREDFRKAIQSSNERWLTYIYFAIFLEAIQEANAAQEVLSQMLTRDPHYERNSPAPFGFFSEKENYTEYLDAFNRIFVDPSRRKERELGRLYINYLRRGPSSKESQRILRLAKTSGIRTRVIALKALLDNNAPPKSIKEMLNRLPQNLDDFGYYAYVLRGEAHFKLGNSDASASDFRMALKLGPRTAISRLSYAKWLQKQTQLQQAEEQIKLLRSYHPQYIPAILASRKF